MFTPANEVEGRMAENDKPGDREATSPPIGKDDPTLDEARVQLAAAFGTSGIGLTMVFVKPGTFRMGTEGDAGNETAHTVTITKGFWIGETEVTQKQWRSVMGSEPWKLYWSATQGDDVAATHVSWTDAVAFCDKLTERARAAGQLPEGHSYQLPTEAEWEMACRGGSNAAFCYGDDEGRLGQFAVFSGSRDGTHANPVHRRKANDFGLYDMHGNVWEWCADCANYESPNVVTDTYHDGATDPLCLSGSLRVVRGGSWNFEPAGCRSASRDCFEPAGVGNYLGFRPVLAARSSRK